MHYSLKIDIILLRLENLIVCLQGRVKFPTGGKVREQLTLQNWCNSSTDSKVWMEEDGFFCMFIAPEDFSSGVFNYI